MAALYWIHLPEHTDITSEGYIGFTSRSVDVRLRTHKSDSKRERYKHLPLYRAMKKYGTSLIVTTLVLGPDDYCLMLENKLRPAPKIGWNINVGGERGSLGNKRSRESCEKQSKTMTGQKRSKSHCESLSAALTGKKKSEAHCKAMSDYNKSLEPWENGRAHKNNWAQAQEFYEKYVLKPSVGAWALGKLFGLPMHRMAKILSHFRSGWNPSTDPAYLAWLADYNSNKEINGT